LFSAGRRSTPQFLEPVSAAWPGDLLDFSALPMLDAEASTGTLDHDFQQESHNESNAFTPS
jgi:hypothetical protein